MTSRLALFWNLSITFIGVTIMNKIQIERVRNDSELTQPLWVG